MIYSICQVVRVVDMNNEIMKEVLFEHGELDKPNFFIGCSVITNPLGLRQFDVVYDLRTGGTMRHKIIDIEFNLVEDPVITRAYLEPVTLIVGQHDIGKV